MQTSLYGIFRNSIGALACAASIGGAHAFVGADSDLPYVVRIAAHGEKSSSCTGVVIEPQMVATAGHCVYSGGKHLSVEIHFTDKHGVERRVPAQRLFLSDAFKQIEPFSAILENEEAMKSGVLSLAQIVEIRRRSAAYDLSIILPYEDIRLSSYVGQTILDDSLPFVAALRPLQDPAHAWNDELRTKTVSLLKREFFPHLEGDWLLGAGFGKFTCTDYANRDTCAPPDGRRRMGMVPRVIGDWLVDTESGKAFVVETLKNDKKVNPFLPGDSGGPIIAVDKRALMKKDEPAFILVAVVSRSGRDGAVHASLLQNAGLWLQFRSSLDYLSAQMEMPYGALAVSQKVHPVGIGIASAPTLEEAKRLALKQCRVRGRNCTIVHTFGGGVDRCLYATVGNRSDGWGKWARGTTPHEALANCQTEGFACREPIGGCLW